MTLPRLLLGAALLVSARFLPALELSMEAWEHHGLASVRCRGRGLDEGDLLRSMDGGATVRIIWQFRLGDSDTSIVRYARRDALGEGYIIFSENPEELSGPYDSTGVLDEFTGLSITRLEALGLWDKDEALEGRLLLDYEVNVPPLSFIRSYTGRRDHSAWELVPYPGKEAP